MKKQGALFDLDGVIIDTEPLYTEFWGSIGRRFHHPSPTFALDIKGTTLADILNTHFAPELHAEIKALIHQFEDTMRYPVFDGAVDLLKRLRSEGFATAIVTSSDSVKMSYLFRQHPDLEAQVDTIVDGSTVKRSKPDPEGYLMAAQRLGCDIADCFVFEDSLQGLEAGRRAGAHLIALATTNPRTALAGRADIIVDRISDPAILPFLHS